MFTHLGASVPLPHDEATGGVANRFIDDWRWVQLRFEPASDANQVCRVQAREEGHP